MFFLRRGGYTLLEMRNITKSFGAVVALDKASLTLQKGEIMALLGSNGSGKSTLVKVLHGLVKQNEGDIFLDGNKVSIKNCTDARNLGIAVAYQDLSLIPNMSVLDNICLNIEPVVKLGVIDKKKTQEKAMKYLEMLKIDVNPNDLVSSLRPSSQSMVEIAKSLALDPRILVLDEATASLHSDEVDVLFDLLKELNAKGMTIVMVTHRMNEIFRLCNRCTILKTGETVLESDVSTVDVDEIVFHMTGKRPDKTTHVAEESKDHSKENPVLDIKNLCITRRLTGVNFTAYKNEIVGIGGLDGQGQSDFIRAILADVAHTDGQILYQGKEVKYKSTADAISDDIGFISGDRARESIFPIRSVAENIFAGNAAKGSLFSYLSSKEVNTFAEKAMRDYNIVAGSLQHPANSLSGGNQQKLVVGRWLALSPQLLLLDDPTKGVDIHSRREIHTILRKCVDSGMSVIYVSSDNEELLEISDRIYVFYEGQISAELSGAHRTEEKLVAAMLGINNQGSQNNE